VKESWEQHRESKPEGAVLLLGCDWLGLTGMRLPMNHRTSEPERILVTLLLLQIREVEAPRCEGKMRPPPSIS